MYLRVLIRIKWQRVKGHVSSYKMLNTSHYCVAILKAIRMQCKRKNSVLVYRGSTFNSHGFCDHRYTITMYHIYYMYHISFSFAQWFFRLSAIPPKLYVLLKCNINVCVVMKRTNVDAAPGVGQGQNIGLTGFAIFWFIAVLDSSVSKKQFWYFFRVIERFTAFCFIILLLWSLMVVYMFFPRT